MCQFIDSIQMEGVPPTQGIRTIAGGQLKTTVSMTSAAAVLIYLQL